jgi:hypothetical protein
MLPPELLKEGKNYIGLINNRDRLSIIISCVYQQTNLSTVKTQSTLRKRRRRRSSGAKSFLMQKNLRKLLLRSASSMLRQTKAKIVMGTGRSYTLFLHQSCPGEMTMQPPNSVTCSSFHICQIFGATVMPKKD